MIIKFFIVGTEVCWPPYGCFNDDYPFDNNWVQLPQSPQYINTKFMLYTRKEKYNPDILSDLDANTISISHFDARKKTIIMCHGYLGETYNTLADRRNAMTSLDSRPPSKRV